MDHEISKNMRVRTADVLGSKNDLKNIPASETGKRLSGKFGTVVCQIAGQDGDTWWVEHDQPPETGRAARASRNQYMETQERDTEIEKIWDRRGRMAPYKASELTPVR